MKAESSIRTIPFAQHKVFERLSDLSNLEAFKDKVPADQVKNLSFTSDSMSFEVSPVGTITLQIIEKEPHSTIKFGTTNSPLPFNLWIQLLPTVEEACKMKLTIGVDINPVMGAMLKKPMQEGVEKMAEALSMIPYT